MADTGLETQDDPLNSNRSLNTVHSFIEDASKQSVSIETQCQKQDSSQRTPASTGMLMQIFNPKICLLDTLIQS